MADRANRSRAWQEFWAADRTESCLPRRAATDVQIKDYWRDFFSTLEGGSRVLDIATGNGALLRQAVAAAGSEKFELTGIDLAEIDPLKNAPDPSLQEANAHFIGGVDAARLPFDDASFDAVVSQYGLEYADLERALGEIQRVLVAGGHLQCLVHSADSIVVTQHADQYRQVDYLLEKNGVVETMSAYVERIERKKSLKITTLRLARTLKAAEIWCRENPPADIVIELCRGFAGVSNRWQSYTPPALRKMINHAKRELIAHKQRILDLNDAVVTGEREALIRRYLSSSAWSTFDMAPLHAGEDEESFGFLIKAQRSAEC